MWSSKYLGISKLIIFSSTLLIVVVHVLVQCPKPRLKLGRHMNSSVASLTVLLYLFQCTISASLVMTRRLLCAIFHLRELNCMLAVVSRYLVIMRNVFLHSTLHYQVMASQVLLILLL